MEFKCINELYFNSASWKKENNSLIWNFLKPELLEWHLSSLNNFTLPYICLEREGTFSISQKFFPVSINFCAKINNKDIIINITK